MSQQDPQNQSLPTAAQRATTALRNGRSRAKKHIAAEDYEAGARTLFSAMRTAERWLDGTHPQMDRASK